MADILESYRRVKHPLPDRRRAWQLHGAGLENLGRERQPEWLPMPEYGPDELLVRVDAAGLCFSDIKILTLGGDHPRLYGRDLSQEPIIPGHESALTVVGVGENLQDRFQVGDRFIVQADIYYQGVGLAYGYMLPGALAQYGVIGKEILEGDEGCYLLPVQASTGYAEAALTEPWACVEASYRIRHRETLKPEGIAWFLGTPSAGGPTYEISRGLDAASHPRKILLSDVGEPFAAWLREQAEKLGLELVEVNGVEPEGVAALAREQTGENGFDDLLVLGAADPALVQAAAAHLARHGILNLVTDEPLAEEVALDVGRVHYDGTAYVGTTGRDIAAAYGRSRQPSELRPGGKLWVIGAGGPMGQMHVLRAVAQAGGPQVIVASDIDSPRLETVEQRVAQTVQEKGLIWRGLNPAELAPEAFEATLQEVTHGEGFDDIIVLAPVPRIIEHAASHLAPGGVLNIFAGVQRGTLAKLNLSDVALRDVRFVGSSGSTIADLRDTLAKTESGQIQPNYSVAAIGGIKAAWAGMESVKSGTFAGKIVIYPQIEDLDLTPLTQLAQALPTVAKKLTKNGLWTKEAEEELLRTKLRLGDTGPRTPPNSLRGGPEPRSGAQGMELSEIRNPCPRLPDRVAIVTGAGQGLGEAIARRLAQEGCEVVVADINLPPAEKVAADIEAEFGRRALAVRTDVTNEAEVAEMVRRTVEEWGRIDILVANAGIVIAGELTEFPLASWRKVIDVNLIGYFLCAREVVKVMKPQRRGVIIQINSKSGKKGSSKNSAYAASKFGGLGLTQSLALELAADGIRVNAVCPGNLLDSPLWQDSLYEQYAKRWGLTPEEVRKKYEAQVPMGRGCTYQDVTNVVVFLASDESAYMTGQAINVTGGQEMR